MPITALEETRHHPFGMVMPWRHWGNTAVNGTGGIIGGGGVPANLVVSSRDANGPAQYTATAEIDFLPGFESGDGDSFVAYIDPNGNAGNSTTGTQGGEKYPYSVNGQLKSDEIAVNTTSAQYWEYDSRIVRRWNVDPLTAKFPWQSPYCTFDDNPISKPDPTGAGTESIHIDPKGNVIKNVNDGDNSVFVHAQGITGRDIDKTYNSKNHSAGGLKIGKIGKTIDVSNIFKNLLNADINYAKGIANPLTFRKLVKGHGLWDLKNNKNTIYGLAHSSDKGKTIQTQFIFEGKNYEADDLGNYHYGATGMAVWCLTAQILLVEAGAAQIAAGTSMPEWQVHEDKIVGTFHGGSRIIKGEGALMPPYGDDPHDQEMIKEGFKFYEANK